MKSHDSALTAAPRTPPTPPTPPAKETGTDGGWDNAPDIVTTPVVNIPDPMNPRRGITISMPRTNMHKAGVIPVPDDGMLVIVGPNGSGKTTLIMEMAYAAYRTGAVVIMRDLMTIQAEMSPRGNDKGKGKEKTRSMEDDADIVGAMIASGGHRMVYALKRVINETQMVIEKTSAPSLWLIIDSLDSCTSPDTQRSMAAGIINAVKAMKKSMRNSVDIHVIITANSYELTKHGHCVDTRTLREVKFDSYEDFDDFVSKRTVYKA
jgi:archaellum biogenesis ATPase FlaH